MTAKNIINCLLIILLIINYSCSRKVSRVAPDSQIDLSGRWNSTDSKIVAEEMMKEVLGRAWIPNFKETNDNKRPIVIVGLVQNKSHEHISAETFIQDMERAIVNDGRVRLVQAADKREELRGERAQQEGFASPETQKKWGRELGADFMLQGDINSIVDTYKKEKVVFYKINLKLANLETNEIVWIGDKEIKKIIKR